MSIKSYTLADGTTATVNATDNGIPFNEGMNVLSKAIKAKIDTSSGGEVTSSKQKPTITWSGVKENGSTSTACTAKFTVTSDTSTLLAGYCLRFDEDVSGHYFMHSGMTGTISVPNYSGGPSPNNSHYCQLFVAVDGTDNYENGLFTTGFRWSSANADQ